MTVEENMEKKVKSFAHILFLFGLIATLILILILSSLYILSDLGTVIGSDMILLTNIWIVGLLIIGCIFLTGGTIIYAFAMRNSN